jgi:F-type H+-transporting ATPase subunit a
MAAVFAMGSSPPHQDSSQPATFNPGDAIMHHIQDAHQLHFFKLGDFDAVVHLPIIAVSQKGIDVFGSKRLVDGAYQGYQFNAHGKIERVDGAGFLNLSITKNVLMMLLGAFLLVWLFRKAAKAYTKRDGQAPKGVQSFLETIIVFVRDQVVRPVMGEKGDRYMPYLLTVFFFIWICNLIGLLPGFAANITGNIAVTMTLALFTFFITMFSSTRHYWAHMIKPPGVPAWVLPIIVFVEFIGIFVKPIALCIRLFANMTAGHIIILSFAMLIFIFGEMSTVAGFGVSVVSVAFMLFMFLLELLVAALQAYIFTILSATFINEAAAAPSHDHH